MQKEQVLVILGPTASGKTSLAVELAKECNGEVISADSMQVYRGLNVGTGKVTKEEMDGVPHHLLDVADPMEQYTVADFVRDAEVAIADITNRGKLPIIAGGTFFYVDALLGRASVPDVAPNDALRQKLAEQPTETLFASLQNLDPERAATIEPHNKRRLIRALEIVEALGHVPKPEISDEKYDTLVLAIKREKGELHERFKARAKEWIENAAFQTEIAALLAHGVERRVLERMGFEYQLGLALHDAEITTDEFIQQFIEQNWQYARRQRQWLKRYDNITWIDICEPDAIIERVKDWNHSES